MELAGVEFRYLVKKVQMGDRPTVLQYRTARYLYRGGSPYDLNLVRRRMTNVDKELVWSDWKEVPTIYER